MGKRAIFPLDAVALDRTSTTPLHRQLYKLLQSYIVTGRLAAGSRLPATRALADLAEVGRNTVIAAYEQLLIEGYVEARSGSGTWVADVMRRCATAEAPGPPAPGSRFSRRGETIAGQPQFGRRPHKINFQPGFPEVDTFPFSTWARLLAQNARSRSDDLLSYYHFAGHPALREAIAEYLGVARGVDCRAEQVIVVTGAQAALDLLARTLMDEGDVAWMEEPGYIGARAALLSSGARLAPLRVGTAGWALGDPALPPPRLIYVTPSCQWPSGTIMRLEERLQLLSIADRHAAWIVEDDYDGEYRYAGRPLAPLRALDRSGRVAYLASFSKLLFPALRLSYVVLPEALVPAAEKRMMAEPARPSLLGQGALARFIADGHFATHLRRTRLLYAARQEALLAGLERHLARWLEGERDPGGMHLIARPVAAIAPAFDDRAVCVAAAHAGIALSPLSACYAGRRRRHGLILGYAGTPEEAIAPACATLARVLHRAWP